MKQIKTYLNKEDIDNLKQKDKNKLLWFIISYYKLQREPIVIEHLIQMKGGMKK